MRRLATVAAIAAAAAVALASPAFAAKIAPPQSQPRGQGYAEWAVEWWQWALEEPTATNPFVTGTCSSAENDKVWFLVGVAGGGSAERTCTIRPGTALFMPLINNYYGAFLNDDDRSVAFVRAQARCVVHQISAVIDGVALDDPLRYAVTADDTPLFDVQLPADNIFKLTEGQAPRLLLSPSAQEGHYLFLRPMAPGRHTIQWDATGPCGTQHVQYTVNVLPGERDNA